MNDLDPRLDEILHEETAVAPRTLPAGTERRVARRHASLVAATCVGMLAGIALLVSVLGPLRGPDSAPPSAVPASEGVVAPAGYVQPAGWPTVDFTNTNADVNEILAATDPSMDHQVVLAAGTVDGWKFGLMSYEPNASSPDLGGTCGGVVIGDLSSPGGPFEGPGGGCTEGFIIRVPADRDMFASTNFAATPMDTFEAFNAIVSHRVASVRATMDDGTVVTFPTIPGPSGSPIDQVVFFAPFGLGGRVQALATDGTVLDHASVCAPTDVRKGTDVSTGCTGTLADPHI
jgi:hypothetical protein